MGDKQDKMVTGALARLMAELAVTGSRDPDDMDRVGKLIDDANARTAISDLLCAIMPEQVDEAQWLAWLQGGSPPLPRPLQKPDTGPRPHARGVMMGAQARHDAAADRVAELEAKLAEARGELALAARELKRANEQVRIVVICRLMVEFGKQASALSLGPLYALARAVSGYFQQDAEFEAGLDSSTRDLLEERRKTRQADSHELLDRLDRYAGDPLLELKLHHAILKVVREVHDAREAENAAARDAGKPMPAANKRRAVRRTSAAQQREVHPAAIRSDAPEVFEAFNRLDDDINDAGPASDR